MRTQTEIRKREWPFVVELHQNVSTRSARPFSPDAHHASSTTPDAEDRQKSENRIDGGTPGHAVPVGFVHVDGAFAAGHSNELLRLFRQHEKLRQQQQPGERILGIAREGSDLVVATNSMPFVRSLALRLSACYWGSLALKYSQGDKLLHAFWWRQPDR